MDLAGRGGIGCGMWEGKQGWGFQRRDFGGAQACTGPMNNGVRLNRNFDADVNLHDLLKSRSESLTVNREAALSRPSFCRGILGEGD